MINMPLQPSFLNPPSLKELTETTARKLVVLDDGSPTWLTRLEMIAAAMRAGLVCEWDGPDSYFAEIPTLTGGESKLFLTLTTTWLLEAFSAGDDFTQAPFPPVEGQLYRRFPMVVRGEDLHMFRTALPPGTEQFLYRLVRYQRGDELTLTYRSTESLETNRFVEVTYTPSMVPTIRL